MAYKDIGHDANRPWGMIVTCQDNKDADYCLLIYPTVATEDELKYTYHDDNPNEYEVRSRIEYPIRSWQDVPRFGLPTGAYPSILYPRGPDDRIFCKVDSMILTGSYLLLKEPKRECMSIVLVFSGNVDLTVLESYQKIIAQLTTSINSVKDYKGYIEGEINVVKEMLDLVSNPKKEDDDDSEDSVLPPNKSPFDMCLEHSTFLQILRQVYDEIETRGYSRFCFKDYVNFEITSIVKPPIYSPLLPTSFSEMMELLGKVRPRHTLLFLDKTLHNRVNHPSFKLFLTNWSNELSFEEIRLKMACTRHQVMSVVHYLVRWNFVVIVYPISLMNVYVSSNECKASIPLIAKYFTYQFPKATDFFKYPKKCDKADAQFLAQILSIFSKPLLLSEFYQTAKQILPDACDTQVVEFLIKTGLIKQLQKNIRLRKPPRNSYVNWSHFFGHNPEIPLRYKLLLDENEVEEPWYRCISYIVADYLALNLGCTERLFDQLHAFMSLLPILHDGTSFEELMFTCKVSQTLFCDITKTFSAMLMIYTMPAVL